MTAGDDRKRWEQTLGAATTRVEDDLRRAIAFLNDEVVPDVRRNSSVALQTAADELYRLAKRIDNNGRPHSHEPAQTRPARPAQPNTPDR